MQRENNKNNKDSNNTCTEHRQPSSAGDYEAQDRPQEGL